MSNEKNFKLRRFLITIVLLAVSIVWFATDGKIKNEFLSGLLNFIGPFSLILFVIFLIVISQDSSKRKKMNANINYISKLPEIRVLAKVVAKSTSTVSVQDGSGPKVAPIFTITFELPDKKRIYFNVDDNQYFTFVENDEGLLIYKEDEVQKWFFDLQRR